MPDTTILRDAVFSPDALYRYSALRTWEPLAPRALFIGLNPSEAGGLEDNPTIRRVMGFARDWGYGGVDLLNLFAWRATTPKALKLAAHPHGPDNDTHVLEAARSAALVVAAWGTHGAHMDEGERVRAMLNEVCAVHCLGLTKGGHPRHPLYLRKDTPATPWEI